MNHATTTECAIAGCDHRTYDHYCMKHQLRINELLLQKNGGHTYAEARRIIEAELAEDTAG